MLQDKNFEVNEIPDTWAKFKNLLIRPDIVYDFELISVPLIAAKLNYIAEVHRKEQIGSSLTVCC